MKKKEMKVLYVVLILIFLMVVFLRIYNENSKLKEEEQKNIAMTQINTITQETLENNEKEMKASMLKESNERERMQSYFSSFMTLIEDKKYEQAYAILYDEFKTNYFTTESKFKEYCDKKFNFQMFDIEYINIERNGDIYILWININDPVGDGETISLNAVIKENDFNDYVLSFSV